MKLFLTSEKADYLEIIQIRPILVDSLATIHRAALQEAYSETIPQLSVPTIRQITAVVCLETPITRVILVAGKWYQSHFQQNFVL